MRIGSDRNKKNEAPVAESSTAEPQPAESRPEESRADESAVAESRAQESAADDERLAPRSSDEERATANQPWQGVDAPVDDRSGQHAARETERTQRYDIADDRTANSAATLSETASPVDDSVTAKTQEPPRAEELAGPLIAVSEVERLRIQWRELQGLFVDNPQDAVTRADELVGGTIQQLTDVYADRKQDLENRWSRGESADTEDLRQALRGYRAFFDQLLSTGG